MPLFFCHLRRLYVFNFCRNNKKPNCISMNNMKLLCAIYHSCFKANPYNYLLVRGENITTPNTLLSTIELKTIVLLGDSVTVKGKRQ